MQVVSGKYRGYQLKTLPGMNTRPMIARMKEDAFNILNNYFIYEKKIGLDIFAGSGQLGIEALSRGIEFCYFNDMSREACGIINTNLQALKVQNAKVLTLDYRQVLNYLAQQNIQIHLLLLDPPFAQVEFYHEILSFMLDNNILAVNGMIICESREPFDFSKYNLVLLKTKDYKNKYLYILRREQ